MSAPAVRPPDSRVYETADDAAVSKLSAVRHGYFNDPFMGLFVRRFQRRSPLINRGYFARFLAVDTIVRRFLAVCAARKEKAQIVSLGAGFDATFFRLAAQKAGPSMFLEVDFPDVTVRKASIIAKHAALLKLIAGQALTADDMRDVEAAASSQSSGMDAGFGRFSSGGSRSATSSRSGGSASATPSSPGAAMPPVPEGVKLYLPGSTPSAGAAAAGGSAATSAASAAKLGGSSGAGAYVAGPGYRLVTADLRDVASLQAALRNAGVDFTAPTLFLSECVLVYLEPEESCAIIAWAAQAFAASVFVTYEQIRPHDAFGQIMSRNLADRGYTLRGLNAFPDLAAQRARYTELGYGAVSVADMNDVYYRILPPGEVARTERLELFDEVEEWHLMSAHYCIAVAVNDRRAAAAGGVAGAAGAAGGPGAAAAAAAGGSAASAVADVAATSKHSESGASGGGGAEGASTVAESPKELAAAVVHAHEESAASEGPHGRGRTGSRSSGVGLGLPFPAALGADAASHDSGSSPLPAASPASSVHSGVGGGSGLGLGGGGGGGGFAGAGLSIHSARSVHSTASVGGAVTPEVLPPDLRAATEAMAAAAGTAVESVELSDGGSLSSRGLAGDGASPVAALHGAGVAPHAGHAFAFPGHHGAAAAPGGTPDGGSGSGAAEAGGATIATLHTHGGDVIISAHGAVDFEAIAQAEEEMAAARHMRDRANINSEMQRGRSGSIGGAPVLCAGASAGGGDKPRASSGSGPAHGGRRPSGAGVSSGAGAAGSPRIPSYTVEELAAKVKADPGAVSLADVLFPVDAWAAAAGAVATTVGAVAPASASSASSGQSGGASYRVVRM